MFFGRCQAVLKFKLVQEVDSSHIPSELFLCATHTEVIIGNAVVVLFAVGDFGVGVIYGKCWLRLGSFNHFGDYCGFFFNNIGFNRVRYNRLFLSCGGYVSVLKNGYGEVGVNKLIEILIYNVIRNTAHWNTVVVAADWSARQSKVKHVCNLYGIVTEELVKVAYAHHRYMLRISFLRFLITAQNRVA